MTFKRTAVIGNGKGWAIGLRLATGLLMALAGYCACASERSADEAVTAGELARAGSLYEQAASATSIARERARIERKRAQIEAVVLPGGKPRPALTAAVAAAGLLDPLDPERVRTDLLSYRCALIDGEKSHIERLARSLNGLLSNSGLSATEGDAIDSLLTAYSPAELDPGLRAQRLLAIAERQRLRAGERDPDRLVTLSRAVYRLLDAKRFDEALRVNSEVVEGRRSAFGPLHYETLFALADTLWIEAQSGDFAAADKHAVAIADPTLKVLGVHSFAGMTAVAAAYGTLTKLHPDSPDRFRLAEAGYQGALEQFGADADYTRQFAAGVCAGRQRSGAAMPAALYEECGRQWTGNYQVFDTPDRVLTLIWLEGQFAKDKRADEQRRMMDLCVAHARRVLGDADERGEYCFAEHARLYSELGDHARAVRSARTALELARKLPNLPMRVVQAQMALASNLLVDASERDEALDLYEQARLGVQALNASDRSQIDEAITLFRQVAQTTQCLDSARDAFCVRLHALAGDQARPVASGLKDDPAAAVAVELSTLSASLAHVGPSQSRTQLLSSERRLLQAGDPASNQGLAMILSTVELMLTGLIAPQDPEQAHQHLAQFEQIAEHARLEVSGDARQYAHAFLPYSLMYRWSGMIAGGPLKNAEDAFRLLERGKSRMMADRVAQSVALQSTVLGADMRNGLTTAWHAVEAGEQAMQDAEARNDEARRLQALTAFSSARRRFDDARNRAVAGSPRLAAMLQPPEANVQALRKALPADAVWVDYGAVSTGDLFANAPQSLRGAGLYAVVVDHEGVHYQSLGDTDALDKLVRDYCVRLASPEGGCGGLPDERRRGLCRQLPEPQGSRAQIGEQLSALLLEPIAAHLKGKRLIIAPDGPLAQLPFEVLPFRGAPLLQRFEVSQTPSAAVWIMLQARGRVAASLAGRLPLAAFGGARYEHRTTSAGFDADGKPVTSHWEDLPGTRTEAKAVAALVPGAKLFVGPEASEATLDTLAQRGELRRLRMLHFATHGFFDARNPLDSGIVLDLLQTDDRHDGVLNAHKWLRYELGTDLIVMSACETGLGRIESGEGLLGLSWALAIAGNRDLIVSLWSVDDSGTERLMEHLYRHLNKGERPAAALAAAKREMLTDARYSDPHYWAPFVLQGT